MVSLPDMNLGQISQTRSFCTGITRVASISAFTTTRKQPSGGSNGTRRSCSSRLPSSVSLSRRVRFLLLHRGEQFFSRGVCSFRQLSSREWHVPLPPWAPSLRLKILRLEWNWQPLQVSLPFGTPFSIDHDIGGCFWGLELAFQRVPGVIKTSVGYTQGTVPNPTYELVCSGLSGHTEAVQVRSYSRYPYLRVDTAICR